VSGAAIFCFGIVKVGFLFDRVCLWWGKLERELESQGLEGDMSAESLGARLLVDVREEGLDEVS
jgi:hypothetical protein